MIFGVVPKGNTVNFTYREINVTWIIMTVQKEKTAKIKQKTRKKENLLW